MSKNRQTEIATDGREGPRDGLYVMQSLPKNLTSRAGRQRSVLILRGTGLNAWHYYPFLRAFSIQDLLDFRAIYGVSGGAPVFWMHLLGHDGLFREPTTIDYDEHLRRQMNRQGLWNRLLRVVKGRFPYTWTDNLAVLQAFLPEPALTHCLKDLAVPLRVVAHDADRDRLCLIDHTTHPNLPVARLVCAAGAPRSEASTPIWEDAGQSLTISDFDFAPRHVKQQFREHLETQHGDTDLYHVNIMRSGVSGRTHYVRVCLDRWPRIAQKYDLAALFIGLPSGRYYRAFAGGPRLECPPK